jgi:hypothetical protein
MKTETTIEQARKHFMTFVRTKQFLKLRLRGIDEGAAVHIPQKEIANRFFPYPKYDCKKELEALQADGLLKKTESTTAAGHTMFNYESLEDGEIDFYLIKPKAAYFNSDEKQMIETLKTVTVDEGAPELPVYFESFLNFRDDCMELFISVDEFAGRMHTPITNLHRPIRPYLLLDGQTTIGIDVTTMQPLLLGKLLKESIGANEYSNWIESGEDIYIKLQTKAGLETRDQGKKRFFEILFAKPNNSLATMFGYSEWITWINEYKTQTEPRNPHNIAKPYSNVAWLLQNTEVDVMRQVWHKLIYAGIPFLSVHDEIICKISDAYEAETLFRSVLEKEFPFYKLNMKQRGGTYTPPPQQSTVKPPVMQPQAEVLPTIAASRQPQSQALPEPVPHQYMPPPIQEQTKRLVFGEDGNLTIIYPWDFDADLKY